MPASYSVWQPLWWVFRHSLCFVTHVWDTLSFFLERGSDDAVTWRTLEGFRFSSVVANAGTEYDTAAPARHARPVFLSLLLGACISPANPFPPNCCTTQLPLAQLSARLLCCMCLCVCVCRIFHFVLKFVSRSPLPVPSIRTLRNIYCCCCVDRPASRPFVRQGPRAGPERGVRPDYRRHKVSCTRCRAVWFWCLCSCEC